MLLANELLQLAESRIWEAIAAGDDLLCYQSVAVIMDWGRVYVPTPRSAGNQAAVEALYNNRQICSSLRKNISAMMSGNTAQVVHMNSGWTKVYAAAIPDGQFIMYDSRVSKALCSLLAQWSSARNLQVAPSDVDLRQVVPNGDVRFVAGIPVATNGAARVRSNILASSLVRGMCQLSGHIAPGSWLNGKDSRYIESRLFMLGA